MPSGTVVRARLCHSSHSTHTRCALPCVCNAMQCMPPGIGFEIARALAQRSGTRTVLAARNEERGRAALEKLRAELPAADLLMHQLDITDQASVEGFARWARDELQRVDVLVNNAGRIVIKTCGTALHGV